MKKNEIDINPQEIVDYLNNFNVGIFYEDSFCNICIRDRKNIEHSVYDITRKSMTGKCTLFGTTFKYEPNKYSTHRESLNHIKKTLERTI